MTRRRKTLRSIAPKPVIAVLAVVTVGRIVAAHPGASAAAAALIVAGILCVLLTRWRARRLAWRRQVALSREITRYGTMAPAEFEQALAVLCARDGCTDVDVTGKAGDLGADVVARSPAGAKVVLQAKRYATTNKVTGPDLQRFGGTCFTVHHAHVAAVVTTSTFTKAAHEYARHAGIRLIDAAGLAAWAGGTGPAPWHRHRSSRTLPKGLTCANPALRPRPRSR
ncbi:restriction endonuclease [Amycolatopsis sp. NPDC051758]|uniref:restriction endonuclease n=1 Tax=Amycolatopsis sp. NPDC051758 TaxID=3363935 RepID=UPI0037A5AF30